MNARNATAGKWRGSERIMAGKEQPEAAAEIYIREYREGRESYGTGCTTKNAEG